MRRFARAASIDELLVKAVNRASLLDGFTAHLTTRFAAGVTDAVTLHAEIQALGFTDSVQTVRRYLHPLRHTTGRSSASPPVRPAVPKPRRIVRWIMTDPQRLNADDLAQLTDALSCCPELQATAAHVRDFADLMHKHHGDRLPDWMRRVEADNLPALHSLVTGLRRDLAAVYSSYPYPAEGAAWPARPTRAAYQSPYRTFSSVQLTMMMAYGRVVAAQWVTTPFGSPTYC